MRKLTFITSLFLSVSSFCGQLDAIKPFIGKYCTDCHGAKKQKGDTRLDDLSTNLDNVESAAHWQFVLDELNAANMPPEDETQPSLKEMSNAIELLTLKLDEAKKKLNGQTKDTVLRRLNRREYINTVTQLTGVTLQKNDIPEDGGGGGFDTNGDGLFMSAYQFDKYMDLANKVLDQAIVSGDRPKLFSVKEEVEKKWSVSNKKSIAGINKKLKKSKGKLRPNDQRDDFIIKNFLTVEESKFAVVIPISELGKSSLGKRKTALSVAPFHRKESSFSEGTYKIRFKAGLRKVLPDESVSLNLFWRANELQIEKQVYTEENSAVNLVLDPQTKIYEVEMTIRKPTALIFDPLWAKVKSSDNKGALLIDWVEISGPHFKSWPPASHLKIFPVAKSGSEDSYIQKVLASFAYKAFRYEKPSAVFLKSLFKIYKEERAFGRPMLEAVKVSLAMIMSSPQFIYMVEKKKALKASVKGLELANRLSYFLWSSAPDKELISLATSGKLDNPKVLQGQVVRLLKDSRSLHLAQGFVPQWLEYERFSQIAVDPKAFPEFNNTVRTSMENEGIHFFHIIASENLSSLNFIDSDFVVVDSIMRSYYALPGRHKSSGFEKVKVDPKSGRGGLLGQGFYLTMTGNGIRTSPVLRGAVTMDLILGSPSPEPPPNVPELEKAGGKNLSVRQKLELHQNQAQCHSCHKKIDPIGFGLEQFDAIGKLRTHSSQTKSKSKTRSKSKEVFETAGKLPNGNSFKDFSAMKKLIASSYKEKFFRSFTESLLAYALGRNVGFGDAAFIDRLLAAAKRDNYKLGSHILRIVKSPEFIAKTE
jgi:hypothetical protein